jgi:hypothetical protein
MTQISQILQEEEALSGSDRRRDVVPGMDWLGKMLILFGVVLALLGGLLLLLGKIPFLGRLPGDIVIRREHWSFYFPLTTSIVISILLTLLFSFFGRR